MESYRMHRLLITSLVFLCIQTGFANAQEVTKEYRADVGRLFALAFPPKFFEAQGHLIAPTIAVQMRKNLPSLAEKSMEIFSSELAAAADAAFRDPVKFGETVAPSMSRHFSHDDVRQILALYQIPALQKWMRISYDQTLAQMFTSWAESVMPDVCRRTNLRLRQENLSAMPSRVCSN